MDQRRPAKYKDQHGRPWFAEVEKSTGQPCIPLQPEFVAPIVPPKKYVRTDPEIPGRVTINYGLWINELRAADREWWRQAQIVGASEHKEHFNPDAPFSQTILNKMGERPRVARTRTPIRAAMGEAALPAVAAMQGNAWVLGLAGPQGQKPKMPARLAPFFEKPKDELPEFVDEFEEIAPVDLEEKPRNKGGRPTNAERAARLAAVE
jgi:hypothetical protein